jgi:hypothetical protein
LIGLLVVAIAVFCVVYLIRHQFKSSAKTEAPSGRPSAASVAFADLAKRHNAVDSWDQDLALGQPARETPVLTMELEKAWLTDRPILFIGKIKDIKTEDKENYRVIVDRDIFWSAVLARPILKTELRVAGLISKQALESFIAMNPDYLDPANGIALIVKVDAIEPSESAGPDAGRDSGRVGKGHILDLMCLKKR